MKTLSKAPKSKKTDRAQKTPQPWYMTEPLPPRAREFLAFYEKQEREHPGCGEHAWPIIKASMEKYNTRTRKIFAI